MGLRPLAARRLRSKPDALNGAMDGYTHSTYGDAFADVYDEWYQDISDVDATVDLLAELAAELAPLPVLELGVGHRPPGDPAGAPRRCTSSASTRARRCSPSSAENDPTATVTPCSATWSTTSRPARSRSVVRRVQHLLQSPHRGSPTSVLRQRSRQRLAPGGAFVIEAFVPEPQAGIVGVGPLDDGRSVVLSISTHDEDDADRAGSVRRRSANREACGCDRGRSATRPSSNSTRWRRAVDLRAARAMGRRSNARRSPPRAPAT